MFFISRSSSCSVIHVSEDTKIYAKERLVSVIVVVVVVFLLSLNPIQTGGGGGFSNPPSGKIVITPTPIEL